MTYLDLGTVAQLAPLVLFSVLAFWQRNTVLFLVTGAIALFTGLYWYDQYVTHLGLVVGLSMIAYSIYCWGCSFYYMMAGGNE